MSVQVRRRREAASFLSTYVGAQGELLVDTTSNRVQVHDGATPGGWPAAGVGDLSGRNAIINGNFAVNARGYVSGTALAAGAYAHDRWKAGAGGCGYIFAQTAPDTSVTVTTGSLVQAVDVGNVTAASMWLTWIGSAKARAWQGSSPSGVFGAGTLATVGGVAVNALLLTGLAVGTITSIEFQGGSVGLVQLEAALANAGPTRFERRHGEVALCQRYFVQSVGTVSYVLNLSGSAASANQYLFNTLSLPVTMRATPTMALVGAFTQGNCSGANVVAGNASNFVFYTLSTAAGGFNCYNPANGGYMASAEI